MTSSWVWVGQFAETSRAVGFGLRMHRLEAFGVSQVVGPPNHSQILETSRTVVLRPEQPAPAVMSEVPARQLRQHGVDFGLYQNGRPSQVLAMMNACVLAYADPTAHTHQEDFARMGQPDA